jgi:hypothetical protein
MYKVCAKCKKELPLSMFGKHCRHKDGLRTRCKECESSDNKARRQQALQEDYEGTREKERASNLHRMFKISIEFWKQKAEAQENKCAICNKECITGKRLAVDHDHETGVIRDLLCSNCNQGLGKFQDSPQLLDKAAEYLRKHGRT